jgi:hydrogenase maturation protease
MRADQVRCLVLACGNTLRGDDGVGPWLAEWVERNCAADSGVRVLIRQQWTPELAEEISQEASVLFLDCSIESPPGAIRLAAVQPAEPSPGLATHHLGAQELLALAQELYGSIPRNSMLLTVGAGSTELGESFSESVSAALPEVCDLLKSTISKLTSKPDQRT